MTGLRFALFSESRKIGIWRAVRTGHSEKVAHYFVGISIVFRPIYRHPFVGDGFPVPRISETCMGRDGKPVPLRCFYGWSDKFPIFLSAVLRADSLMTGFGATCASAFRQWRLLLCVTGAAHAASGAVTAAGAGTLALFPVADLKENNGTDQQDHNDPRDQSWYVHTACPFRFLTLLQKSLLAGLLPGKGSSARANRS